MKTEYPPKILIVKNRRGEDVELFTYGGSVKLGARFCKKENDPTYECKNCHEYMC